MEETIPIYSIKCLIVLRMQKSTIWGTKDENNFSTALFQVSTKGGDKITLTLEVKQMEL